MSPVDSPLAHRFRRLAAKIVRRGRRIVENLSKPSDVEQQLARLPEIAAARELSGRRIVITGSTRGIGRVVARAFAARGARVVVNGRNADQIAAVLAEMKAAGGDAIGVAADASTPDGVEKLFAAAEAAFGGVDLLVNNAAVPGAWGIPSWSDTPEQFEGAMRGNLVGPWLCARRAIQLMIRTGRAGRIINVSSIATERPYPNLLAYGVTKSALDAMTRYLAADLGKTGITVTSVSLHSVATEAKRERRWEDAELLPPAEILIPVFEHAATAPTHEVHGRVVSSARFLADAAAERIASGTVAAMTRLEYPPMLHLGVPVARDPARFTLLDRAENQHGASPRVAAAIAQSLATRSTAFYPDDRYQDLASALAAEHDMPADSFAIGAGSWEIMNRMLDALVKPGEHVVANDPGWFGFNLLCRRKGIDVVRVPFVLGQPANRAHHNLQGILSAIAPTTRLVYLISPSNPEGVPLRHGEFAEFLAQVPESVVVVVDEAYLEYADEPDVLDFRKFVRETDRPLIGLRTFSKFYALAGMRVGYGYARPPLADLLRRQGQIFTLAHLAEVAAIAALSDGEHRAMVHRLTAAERQRVCNRIAAMGLRYVPSQAPYVLIEKRAKIEGLAIEFQKAGVYIPPYAFYDDGYMMFPIGTREQNDRNLEILQRAI